jgi:hypothetical protein
MLHAIIPSVVMLNVTMPSKCLLLSVIRLNVVIECVVILSGYQAEFLVMLSGALINAVRTKVVAPPLIYSHELNIVLVLILNYKYVRLRSKDR